MAADWIKMRTDLVRDPKLLRMASALADPDGELARHTRQNVGCDMSATRSATRHAAVSVMLSIWGNVRQNGTRDGDDLVLSRSCLEDLDDIAELPGAGEAAAHAGWVEETADGLVFPAFFAVHNVDPADRKREENTERKRRSRARETGATTGATVAPVSRTEERRGEESKKKKRTKKTAEVSAGLPSEPDPDIPTLVCETFARSTGRPCRMTANRRKAIAARLADPFFRENWRDAMVAAERSPFCRGENDRGWVWTLEFFLRPDSVTKLVEGQYDGTATKNGTNGGVERTLGDIADWVADGPEPETAGRPGDPLVLAKT